MRDPEKVLCNSVEYGQCVQGLRKARGLTEDDLGQAIGLTQGAVCHLEKGHRKYLVKPYIEALIKKLSPSTELAERLRKGAEAFATIAKAAQTNAASAMTSSANNDTTTDARQPVENNERPIGRVLLPTYPRSYPDELSSAKELWVSGLNLRRLIPDHEETLAKVLNAGGKIRALLVNPGAKCHANKYAAAQDKGPNSNVRIFRGTIIDALDALCQLRKMTACGKRLEIKTIDYPLPFGLDIKDPKENGIVYVRLYPLNRKGRKDSVTQDRPIMEIKKADGYWYDFYVEQFNQQWGWPTAIEWNCIHRKNSTEQRGGR
jgi:transcriptional regulator with XRE-family HTH domain